MKGEEEGRGGKSSKDCVNEGREGGREEERKRGREEERKRGREEGRKGGREEERKGGREGGRARTKGFIKVCLLNMQMCIKMISVDSSV